MTTRRGNPVLVKICGINTRAAFEAARDAGADYVGFVFFPRSPRCVTPQAAAAIAGDIRTGQPARVGLFVQPEDGAIAAALDALHLDALQLYTDSARARAIGETFGIPIWRAVPVTGADDLPRQAEGADRLLIEPRAPAGATRPGGNAVALDWAITRGWAAPAPWFLAGGLTPETVAEAIRRSGAAAVDVSSGVETAPGRKSPDAIARFVRNARQSLAPAEAAGASDVGSV